MTHMSKLSLLNKSTKLVNVCLAPLPHFMEGTTPLTDKRSTQDNPGNFSMSLLNLSNSNIIMDKSIIFLIDLCFKRINSFDL
jgi:hypothetical protein